jgi:hypothetical protein
LLTTAFKHLFFTFFNPIRSLSNYSAIIDSAFDKWTTPSPTSTPAWTPNVDNLIIICEMKYTRGKFDICDLE